MEPRHLAINILKRIYQSDAYADIVVDNELKKTDLVERDRRFVNELVHGTIRWQKRLDWTITQFFQGDFLKAPILIRCILEITLYQLMFLDKIPGYAAINEGVRLTKKIKGNHWANKVNAILRNFLKKKNEVDFPEQSTDTAVHLSIKYSHPEWLVKRWIGQFGIEATEKLCHSNNQIPKISLRINSLKIDKNKLKEILEAHHIETEDSKYLPEFVKTRQMPNLVTFAPFQKGYFTIQDESAGLVAHLVDPKPGETIIDLCAAPGGKTTHLAELAHNQCKIIAIDRNVNRLAFVRENVQRLGLENIYLVQADATQFSGRIAEKILIDAPCSGLGVLSKRSDLRWKRTLRQIKDLVLLQKQILDNAARLLKPGGALIYSTCTIEADENENQVADFLRRNPGFQFDKLPLAIKPGLITNDKYIYTYPHVHLMDGSFAVRLIKLD